jgi:uncharacterized protein YaaW (UPF0174 family)
MPAAPQTTLWNRCSTVRLNRTATDHLYNFVIPVQPALLGAALGFSIQTDNYTGTVPVHVIVLRPGLQT